jgi:hypothetical protein
MGNGLVPRVRKLAEDAMGRCFRWTTCGSGQSPNGYVSGIPVPWPDGSADTALVRSNQVHASNCIASDDAE